MAAQEHQIVFFCQLLGDFLIKHRPLGRHIQHPGGFSQFFHQRLISIVEIRQTYKVSKLGTIGGGYVIDGYIRRDSGVRVIRDGIVIYEGKLASLKRFKDDVKEVKQGYECGLMIEKYNDIKVGDQIEAYIMEEVPVD